ncbi:amino acid adenylation domain-containing protein [Leptolyngbya sp. AN03gr2]|uniref:non-ribosomal peptide synthetase n=1 Tax=unclassified Leptolyngbya TaxID=2650499 RepID=UPI003D315BCE
MNSTVCTQKFSYVHDLFEAQTQKDPERIALISSSQTWSYQTLNEQANQLAHYLQKQGVQPETLVGLYIERSPEMLIGLLAILKAGGAYVPLDPTYPKERIALILNDAQISVVLTQKQYASEISSNGATIVCVDTDRALWQQESANSPTTTLNPGNLAYVIYTSGSTGMPKGVMIEHHSLSNFVGAIADAYQITPTDRVLQFASISFDVAIEEIFVTLAQGATLVLRSPEMLRSIPTFLEQCNAYHITVLNIPTAFWHKICAEFPSVQLPECVRLVVIGSERALPRWLEAWKQNVSNQVRLVNAYGPTEATVSTTWCDLNTVEVNHRVVPIGKPINNVQVYVLDESGQPISTDKPGELYIAGAGLARGYLNRPELTATKFIQRCMQNDVLVRLYKTGDWVRYREDGYLEFLDRIDNQEKIRGFRIELGEIETLLHQHPVVKDTIVIAREEHPGDKRLVAYVVANPEKISDDTNSALEHEQLAQWQMIHDDDQNNRVNDQWEPTFNISGWANSYTGELISDEEMQEWVDSTVERILALQPKRVLEIGCGTGLLLFRVAPQCLEYVGLVM